MAELAVYVDRDGNTDPRRPRDGDILCAFSDFQIAFAQAEMIARGLVYGEIPQLIYEMYRITNDGQRTPTPEELAGWWTLAAGAGINQDNHRRWPYTALDAQMVLPLRLTRDLSPQEATALIEPEKSVTYRTVVRNGQTIQIPQVRVLQYRRRWIDWRSLVNAEGQARILEPDHDCRPCGGRIRTVDPETDVIVRPALEG